MTEFLLCSFGRLSSLPWHGGPKAARTPLRIPHVETDCSSPFSSFSRTGAPSALLESSNSHRSSYRHSLRFSPQSLDQFSSISILLAVASLNT